MKIIHYLEWDNAELTRITTTMVNELAEKRREIYRLRKYIQSECSKTSIFSDDDNTPPSPKVICTSDDDDELHPSSEKEDEEVSEPSPSSQIQKDVSTSPNSPEIDIVN